MGFPSPATDYLEADLNLHEHVVKKPAATFFMRAKGESMTGAGIYPGDILVVDRSLDPRPGHIVVAMIHSQFTLKRLIHQQGRVLLVAENPKNKSIDVTEDPSFQIFGVVTHNVHKLV